MKRQCLKLETILAAPELMLMICVFSLAVLTDFDGLGY